MTDKIYSHMGVATYKGKTKFRWSMGKVEARVKTLQKGGFENIEFQALPGVMTKVEALKTTVAADLAARYGIALESESTTDGEAEVDQAAA